MIWPNESLQILCCPEDHHCDNPECVRDRRVQSCCQLPMCRECEQGSRGKQEQALLPPAALANDMMIYYAPKTLYTKHVTVMEMLCASVRLTLMICFSLEKKYRGESAFDTRVHMNNHRRGARGNATSFPLPWQELLQQLQASEKQTGAEHCPDFPRSGEELSNFVPVLLKTSDEGDSENKEALARFVHQAVVRRDAVVEQRA